MNIETRLKSEFGPHISLQERRPGVLQVVAPLFHEDGDMVDIFLDLPKENTGTVRLNDHGMTLMRLSYSYDIDTPAKRKVLARILSENGVEEEDGRLTLRTAPELIYPGLLQFAQTLAKVANMHAFKREVVQSLFYESLDGYVASSLVQFNPTKRFEPLPNRDDLDVDWKLHLPSYDIYLYGVRDGAKARLVGLSCLEFQKQGLSFRSVIVHEDFENEMSRKDQRRLTNIADKQFASLPDFMADAESYMTREGGLAPSRLTRPV